MHPDERKPDDAQSDHVAVKRDLWYFAYGSNLDPSTFCGRRRIQPRDSRRARLADYDLRFDLAVGSGNRGVANLAVEPEREVWGVVYRIAAGDALRLDRSEGVHRGFYDRVTVTADCGGDRVRAYTYLSPHGRDGRLPSARYLGLIVAGARHHVLPAAWIDKLMAWPLALDERQADQQRLF